jgi:hypothetical protein
MRLGLWDRIRRFAHPRRSAAPSGNGPQGRHRRGAQRAPAGLPAPGPASSPDLAMPASSGRPQAPARTSAAGAEEWPVPAGWSDHRGPPPPARPISRSSAARAGAARARIREAPDEASAPGAGQPSGPVSAVPAPSAPGASRLAWRDAREARVRSDRAEAASRQAQAEALARVASGVPRQPGAGVRPSLRAAGEALRARLPFAAPHPRERGPSADGRRNCGSLEGIIWRQWDTAMAPPAEVVAAVDRLAELPERIKDRLLAGLDAIFIGPGGVPELDDMTGLRGVRLPSGQASWDACAGAYGERKIVVGTQPSPTPDVMCHEVGHALDDLDSPPGKWQSDSAEFRVLYDQCQPHLASDFHRQPGGLGRKEFFADAFAAIASRQRPALVDMLSGDTRTALRVMLYFNRRYGI